MVYNITSTNSSFANEIAKQKSQLINSNFIFIICLRYHIPRSFLNNGENTLILFEEIGGTPSPVSFRTVVIGTLCGSAYEGNLLEMSCQTGHTISEIQFASFGDPQGTCGSFKKGSCEAANSLSAIQKVIN